MCEFNLLFKLNLKFVWNILKTLVLLDKKTVK